MGILKGFEIVKFPSYVEVRKIYEPQEMEEKRISHEDYISVWVTKGENSLHRIDKIMRHQLNRFFFAVTLILITLSTHPKPPAAAAFIIPQKTPTAAFIIGQGTKYAGSELSPKKSDGPKKSTKQKILEAQAECNRTAPTYA